MQNKSAKYIQIWDYVNRMPHNSTDNKMWNRLRHTLIQSVTILWNQFDKQLTSVAGFSLHTFSRPRSNQQVWFYKFITKQIPVIARKQGRFQTEIFWSVVGTLTPKSDLLAFSIAPLTCPFRNTCFNFRLVLLSFHVDFSWVIILNSICFYWQYLLL